MYGEPATPAVAAAPALVNVTLATLSVFFNCPAPVTKLRAGEGKSVSIVLALITGRNVQRNRMHRQMPIVIVNVVVAQPSACRRARHNHVR